MLHDLTAAFNSVQKFPYPLSSMINEEGSLKEEVKHRVACESGDKCQTININFTIMLPTGLKIPAYLDHRHTRTCVWG